MVNFRRGTFLAIGFLALGGFAAAACSSDDGGGGGNGDDSTGGTIVATGGLGGAGTGASASTGSTSGTGSVGTGGGSVTSPCDGLGTTGGADPLIDDFDDQNSKIREVDGRSGDWYVFNDMSLGATQVPATDVTMGMDADSAHTGAFGFHSTAEKFNQNYGAGFGFSLNSHGTNACTFDAADYDGITFWIKGPQKVPGMGGDVNQAVTLKVQMIDVVPTARGGVCTGDGQCDNSHGFLIPISNFDDTWHQVSVTWDQLAQDPNWGLQIAFDPARIVAVQWTTPKGVGAYDITIDDVAFIGGTPGGQGGAGGAN